MSVKAQVGLWIFKAFASLVRKLTTHVVGLTIVVNGFLFLRGGLQLAALLDGTVLALMGVWLRLDRESYSRRVTQRIKGWHRGVSTYRPGWEQVLSAKKVNLSDKSSTRAGVVIPALRYIRSTKGRDVLRVRMLPGQILKDWVEVIDRLATNFNCREESARVGSTSPWRPSWWPSWLPAGKLSTREIELSFLHVDPLADVVDHHPVADNPDLKALPIALREDGLWYRLRLLGSHLFIVGATGAGKGSVLWSIITQLSGAVRSGMVRLVGLDPKGGVELGIGLQLFHTLCRGSAIGPDGLPIVSLEAAMADLLEEYVRIMRKRQDRMFGKWRTHKPTVDEPFIVIVIDEIASLVAKAYQTDTVEGARFVAALNLLLSQGRAQAISIVGAGQDGRKEVVPMRGLFTDRIALRLNEEGDVDVALGSGSRARGAWCDKISRNLPGIGFAVTETDPEPVRMRFPYSTDDHIRALPAAPVVNLTAVPSTPATLVDAKTPAETVLDSAAPSWLPDEFKDRPQDTPKSTQKGDAA